MLGNEFHMDAFCLGVMDACYVCWLTFDVVRGQGPQVRARHLLFWLSVFKHSRYQLGWSDLSCLFSLGDYLICDPYAPTYPIH